MPGNSGNKSNKPKLHGSTNSLRDTFNQALNEATTAEQARSEANLGEGHSAKSNNTDFADLREWYAKLDHDTKSAMDKAADKPTSRFTNEERDNFYLKVDPYHYLQYLQFRYPNKTEFIQSRMHSYYGFRRHLEENGIAPKKSAETKPETQYAEQAVKEQAKSEKSAEEKALDDVWADSLGIPRSELNSAKPNTASQPAANPEKVTPEKQVAQGMVDNSKPNLLDLSFNEKIYRPWAEEYGERARPNDMDWIPDPTEFWATRDNYPNPQPLVKYNPFLAALRSNGKLTSLGYAGLTGLALLAPYLKQNSTNEQSQTQPPYLMEPESEEETFDLDLSTPVSKKQYVSTTSSDNSVNSEEPVDEATYGFVFPQKLPPLRATLDSVDSPNTADIPKELDTPLLRNASWDLRKIAGDATRLVPMPSRSRQRGARPPLKSGYELPSEARSLTEQELAAQMARYRIASGTRYTPEQRKSNNRINYQDAARQMLGASEAVNNLAREAYDFNKYQNNQKPEAALAHSLLRAQQESRANRGDTGLQQYRYQSLLNSGLRGMTPDEAIRSGLLTPEQVQVLMKGPY